MAKFFPKKNRPPSLRQPVEKLFVIFHKPFDVLPQFTDSSPFPRTTLAEFIPVPGIYPVGRLDLDSEGLLFLTNDNWLKHRMLDPRFEHPRTYWVQVEGEITDAALDQLRSGVSIGDYRTKPAKAKRLAEPAALPPRNPPIRYRASIPTSWLELTIKEGKNRQVRRMTAAVGFPTLRLVRVRIGELELGQLAPGEYRHLTAMEIAQLRESFPR